MQSGHLKLVPKPLCHFDTQFTALLKTNILERATDSFFQGDVYVTLKDKMFQHSHALWHGPELTQLLRENYSYPEDEAKISCSILAGVTDGGPDHRNTYGSVQISHILKSILLDLDLVIAVRTSPMVSWTNLAERLNSLLNLALQNVALERDSMDEHLERTIKHMSTMQELRNKASRNPTLKQSQ